MAIVNYSPNVSLTAFQKVMKEIEESDYQFYLTGSRFFGNATEKSDWDFFVEPYPNDDVGIVNLELFLKSLDFRKASKLRYGDSLCISVMRWESGDISEQIDVQIVKDAALKLKVQEKFKECGVHPTRVTWNLAFMFATV